MSRLSKLKHYWGFAKAFKFYLKLKSGKLDGLTAPCLTHPFSIRNNPYDYATFEEVLLEETYDLKTANEIKYIIDGGGNIGLTACYFASKYKNAEVITLEPDIENFKQLQKNTVLYNNITAILSGIWNEDDLIKITDLSAGNNAFTVEKATENDPGAIKALSISGIMKRQGFPHIDILKLDIEGSEKEVFEGGFEEWLPQTKIVIVELHDEMKKGCSQSVFKAINRYDFSFSIKGENVVFKNNNFI